jgi:hypothetical protein
MPENDEVTFARNSREPVIAMTFRRLGTEFAGRILFTSVKVLEIGSY